MPPRRRLVWLIVGTAALVVGAMVLMLLLRDVQHDGRYGAPDGGLEVPVRIEPLVDAEAGDAAGAAAAEKADARTTPPPPRRQITEQELRALQRRHRGLIEYCYGRAAARVPSMVRTKTTVRVELAAGGRIKSVRVNAGDDAALAACLRRMIRGWRFSPTLKAQWVSFPIVFAR